MKLEGASGGYLVQSCSQQGSEPMQGSPLLLGKPSGIFGFHPGSQNLLCWPNEGTDRQFGEEILSVMGFPAPENTSQPLPGNLSSDIGSEVALKHYQKLLLFSYERGWTFDVRTGICSQKP